MTDSADQAARLALAAAEKARIQGTFGVGAVLVEDSTGLVLDTASNDVVRCARSVGSTLGEKSTGRCHEYRTHDPTAHAERQLISRFFERQSKGDQLPDPGELTIVTSLEPCAMCSGAILTAGFKVGVIALDPTAGLGATGSERFGSLPVPIRQGAYRSFGYYAVPGVRPFVGTHAVAFGSSDTSRLVSREIHDACGETFLQSLEPARDVVTESRRASSSRDPWGLVADDPLRTRLRKELPNFLALRLEDPRQPSRQLFRLLDSLSRNEPARGSSAALVDRFGNVLTASGGGAPGDPTATGFAKTIQTYSQVRYELASTSSLSQEASEYLLHPKFGTLFRYPLPDSNSPATLLELGIYGSTMEGSRATTAPSYLSFLSTRKDADLSELAALISSLPPFYSLTVGITPTVWISDTSVAD